MDSFLFYERPLGTINMSTLSRYHHRQVALTINMAKTLEVINAHFARLIEQVNPLFFNGGPLANKIQKRWYSKQLVDPANGFSYGFLHFTVTNRTLMDHAYDPTDLNSEINNLEYSFHIKQSDTVVLASNFTSGSVRYKTQWGEFNNQRVHFNMYGGTDIESAVLFKDLVEKIKPQLTAFNLDESTFTGQNELQLVGIHIPNT